MIDRILHLQLTSFGNFDNVKKIGKKKEKKQRKKNGRRRKALTSVHTSFPKLGLVVALHGENELSWKKKKQIAMPKSWQALMLLQDAEHDSMTIIEEGIKSAGFISFFLLGGERMTMKIHKHWSLRLRRSLLPVYCVVHIHWNCILLRVWDFNFSVSFLSSRFSLSSMLWLVFCYPPSRNAKFLWNR